VVVGGCPPPSFPPAVASYAAVVARPVARGLLVRETPAGDVLVRLGRRTPFGSPVVVSVAKRRGRWLGVIVPGVPNGRLGWVEARAVRTSRVPLRLEVSLSARRLFVLRRNKVVAHFRVGIGRAGTPTPTGRFAVTDKLPGAEISPVYGCCILALSGNQPHPPPGWRGADTRIAIHGGAFGAISAGCLHAETTALRYLMAHVRLGTRVTIRA